MRLPIISMLVAVLAAGSVQAAQFKIATVAPDGSQWMTALRSAAAEIKTTTEGRVEVKFYPGGVMGNEKKVLRKIRIGQLQGGAFTANGLAERYKDILIYGLPLVFRSREEVDYVRSQMDDLLLKGLDDAGFVSFGFATGGFARIMGDEAVANLDDLRGKKIWVPEGDEISYKVMQALNLSPVVLPITDVLTGLQTGLLEFIATPPVGAVVLQWYTKVKVMTDLPVAYTIGTMAIDKRAFGRLSAEDQAVFRDVMSRAYREADESGWQDEAGAEQALLANGLKSVAPPDAAVAAMRKAAGDATAEMAAKGAFSQQMYQQLQKHLEDFRAGAVAAAATTSANR